MNKRKKQGSCSKKRSAFPARNLFILTGIVLSVSLAAASFTAFLLTGYYNRMQIRTLGSICQGILENQPDAEGAVLSALREYQERPDTMTDENENIILAYGYRQADFLRPAQKYGTCSAAAGFLAGGLVFLLPYSLRRGKEKERIHALTDYLEQVHTGDGGVLFPAVEDEFSQLQDEIYKTVTELHQTRDAAWKAKNLYAENLDHIAHQNPDHITFSVSTNDASKSFPKAFGTDPPAAFTADTSGGCSASLIPDRCRRTAFGAYKDGCVHGPYAGRRSAPGIIFKGRCLCPDSRNGRNRDLRGSGMDDGSRHKPDEKLHGAHPARRKCLLFL